MSTHTTISYHIVFPTKNRAPVLKRDRSEDLFRHIWGIMKNRHSHLYRINGVEDHLHILASLHTTVSLAAFFKDIKTGSPLGQGKQGVQKPLALAGGILRLDVLPGEWPDRISGFVSVGSTTATHGRPLPGP